MAFMKAKFINGPLDRERRVISPCERYYVAVMPKMELRLEEQDPSKPVDFQQRHEYRLRGVYHIPGEGAVAYFLYEGII